MPDQPFLFLSHAGSDTQAALELHRALADAPAARQAGLHVWLDKHELGPGDWQAQIEDALKRMTAFAVLIGPGGVRNWVVPEVRAALNLAVTRGIGFITVDLTGDLDPGSLPLFMQQHNIIRDPLNDAKALSDLLGTALSIEGRAAPLTDRPFVGLPAMTESDALLFFGRDKEIKETLDALKRTPIVLIQADSGSGKSSLVRAGVAPAFRRGALSETWPADPEKTWHVITMRPGRDPGLSLNAATCEAAAALGLPQAGITRLRESLKDLDPVNVALAMMSDLPASQTQTLLILDQMEELITHSPEQQRNQFLDILLKLAQQGGPIRIVGTIRSDYFNLLRVHPQFWHAVESGETSVLRLGSITEDGLRQIVSEPLTRAGFDGASARDREEARKEKEDLVAQIWRDMSKRPGDLALVQIALHAVWRESGAGRDSLVNAYSRVGGIFGALAHEAEAVRNEVLNQSERDRLLPMLVRLVRPGETAGATRRTANEAEFPPETWALAKKLSGESGRRLILANVDTIEIAHEALIRQWPWLQASLQPIVDDVRTLHSLIARASGPWSITGETNKHTHDNPFAKELSSLTRWMVGKNRLRLPDEDMGTLARGSELDLFQDLANRHADWLSPRERDFLDQSLGTVEIHREFNTAPAA